MLWVSAPHCGDCHNWLCNYSTVLTFCQRLSTDGHGAERPMGTIRTDPCVKEVDNRVNFPIFRGIALWMTVDKPDGNQSTETATGIPFKTLVPEIGSNRSSSVRAFEFTPAYSAATDKLVPGTE